MRVVEKAYEPREDDNNAFDFVAFDPSNADKVFTESISNIRLDDLGEGETIFENQEGTIVKYSKIDGKLFQENTTLTEV